MVTGYGISGYWISGRDIGISGYGILDIGAGYRGSGIRNIGILDIGAGYRDSGYRDTGYRHTGYIERRKSEKFGIPRWQQGGIHVFWKITGLEKIERREFGYRAEKFGIQGFD